ncbi:MAG: hypothetical protein J0H99_16945, partial [Rhodospirillales bacterium]|nr:hypothetical protein [Rhodospirillales bacterium]
ANDILDRGAFVDSLSCAVVHTDRNRDGEVTGRRSTGFVVGLTGEWGLGKSSVLNLVKERLDSYDHVAVAALNPWLFNSRDDLLKAYFNVLRDALGKTLKERARDIQEQLDKYKGAIGLGGTVIAVAIERRQKVAGDRRLLELANAAVETAAAAIAATPKAIGAAWVFITDIGYSLSNRSATMAAIVDRFAASAQSATRVR